MRFTDAAPLQNIRKLADGYVTTDAFAVRTGIQLYRGSEVGRPDMEVVRVYRSADEVKSPKSLATFSHAPITIGHPKEVVTADNWNTLAVGEVSTEAQWQDNKIKLPLILKDSRAIRLVESGTRELSAGYICALDPTPGITEDGAPYDMAQRDIRINHLAIVERGRAGAECRIGDSDNWGPAPVTPGEGPSMKNIVLGDQAVSVADGDADKILEFIAELKKQQKEVDTEVATKDAEIAELKKKIPTADQLDARVEQRSALVAKVGLIDAKITTKGVSDAALMRAAAVKHYGAAIKDKSDDYIATAFELIKIATKDSKSVVADPVVVGDSKTNDSAQTYALGDYEAHLINGWKASSKENA